MGVTSHTVESKSPIAPARMFKALFVDSHNLLPKIAPDAIKSIEIIEGDGGAGTSKKINFGDGKYIKNRIDLLDEENLVIKYSLLIEGEDPEKIESISFETKLEAGSEGGSVSKTKVEIHTVGEAINEEELKGGLSQVEAASLLVAAVEAYLSQNADVYA